MYQITDPANNTGRSLSSIEARPLTRFIGFDIHEYLDVDFSGSHSECESLASTYLAPLTAWLEEYNFKAMITEFGAANGTECESYLSDIINYMSDNDVYIGWSAWAAGPFWGPNSACCSDSQEWGSLEPGTTAVDGSPGMYETVWLAEIQPLLPKTLVKSGISSLSGGKGPSGSSSSSSSTSRPTSTKSTSSTTKPTSTKTSSSVKTTTTGVPLYGQCGGISYTGSTTCIDSTCTYSNPYYSQCL
jgi:endoglucanase